jgi:two-component system phosphate regulon sensor histidine kinase PhoR
MTGHIPTSDDAARGLPSSDDLEQTLQRLVRRVAMLMQAEKCVFLLHDRERRMLVARRPALGLTPEELRTLKVPVTGGLSGTAFASGEPVVVQDTSSLEAADQKWLQRLDVRNLIVYPLLIERPDEQARTVDRLPVGVLHVINKRGATGFNDDDVRLLSVMARQVAAVIADAQIYLRLTEEKEQLQATFQSVLAGMVMVDSAGHISLLNPAASQMFGLAENEATGRRYDEVFKNDAIRQMFRDAIEDNEASHREIEINTAEATFDASQPRIFQAQTAFVHGERDGMPIVIGAVAIFNDITEIRNVERMKTAFVSTVSHELRTPLTSIKGFISTLLQDTEGYFGPEERTEFYQIIDSECDRLRRLIEDLLNVSRIESGRALQMHCSTFDPLAAVQNVLQAQRSYTDKHQLKLESNGEIPHITADSDKFDQILTNLVSNAIKYSPSGGEVVVDISSDDLMLHVGVRDQGIGIPADKLHRVFEKFERVDNRDTRQAGGTGIGLFLVKHLVELHQGSIEIESEVGKGSHFKFEIPLQSVQPLDGG